MDLNTIAENLAELLTNSVNVTDIYYDLFINPEPMDITLQQYNSENQLIEVTIPNRAKDRQIALSGVGTPEGNVTAPLGTFYVDTQTNIVYIKINNVGNTGWNQILTQVALNNLPIGKKLVLNNLSKSLALVDQNDNTLSTVSTRDFLNTEQVTNAIISAPNGVATFSGGDLIAKKGLSILFTLGRKTDNTFNNYLKTLSADVVRTVDENIQNITQGLLFIGYNTSSQNLSLTLQRPYNYVIGRSSTDLTNFTGLFKNVDTGTIQYYTLGSVTPNVYFTQIGYNVVTTMDTVTLMTTLRPIEFLTNNSKDEITQWMEPYLDTYEDIPYNTIYSILRNGWIFVGTTLKASVDSNTLTSNITSSLRIGEQTTDLSNPNNGTVVYYNSNGISYNPSTGDVGHNQSSTAFIRVFRGQKIVLRTTENSGNTEVVSSDLRFFRDKVF